MRPADVTAVQRLPLRRHRPLQGFIAALLVSLLGDQVFSLALPWLVYNLTGSALAMGSMYAIGQVPVLLNPFLGTLVDRVNRRALMVASDLLRAALVGLVPLLWFAHSLRLWHLFLLGAILTLLGQIYNVCTFAITPLVVPPEDLPALNSISMSLFSISGTIGPAVAGLFIALVGAPLALLIDAVSFLATVLALVWFRPPNTLAPAPRGLASFFTETWGGIRYYFSHRLLLPLGFFMLLANLGFSLLFAQLLFHYRHDLNLDARVIGILFGAVGLASTLVTLAGPWFMRRLPWWLVMTASRSVAGLFALGHALATSLPAVFGTGVPGASIDSLSGVISNTLRQKIIPREMIGRVQATHLLVCFVANPVGGFLAGVIGERWNAAAPIALGGAVILLSALIIPFSPLRGVGAQTGAAPVADAAG